MVANYKETQLTDVREGQAVDIAVDMFPGQVVHGHVDSIAPASGQEFALLPPDNATGNFTKVVQRIPVKIALDAADNPRNRAASGHVGDSDHRDQFACRSPCDGHRFQDVDQDLPERPEMSSHSLSASIARASRLRAEASARNRGRSEPRQPHRPGSPCSPP